MQVPSANFYCIFVSAIMVQMSIRFATKSEIDNWNNLIIANPDGGNVFSSLEFARQKETGGYRTHFVIIDNLAVTVLEKHAPLIGKLWYLPKGPNTTSLKQTLAALKELTPFAAKRGVFAIRIEPELSRKLQSSLKKHGLNPVRAIIPNPSTILLDISDDLNNLLLKLPQKGRYAIRRAERDGVTIKQVEASDNNCKIMYQILQETAEGQFGIRGFEYFRTFWQRFEKAGYGQLFFAYYNNKVVAGAYAMIYGQKSTYKDGASIRKRSAYGASHLLQWEVIKWAKSHGASVHDLCGAPPSDEIDNTEHPHYRIGLFKTAFSRTVSDYIGCFDYIIKPVKYKIWIKFAEKVAVRLHYYKHRDSYF